MSNTIHWVKCVTCDGIGTIIEGNARGKHYWKKCPRCDGTGLMETIGKCALLRAGKENHEHKWISWMRDGKDHCDCGAIREMDEPAAREGKGE